MRRAVNATRRTWMTIIDGFDELLFKPVARISESRIGGAILLAGYMVLMGLLAVAANL